MERFIIAWCDGEEYAVSLRHVVHFHHNQAGNWDITTDTGEQFVVLIRPKEKGRKDLKSQIITL